MFGFDSKRNTEHDQREATVQRSKTSFGEIDFYRFGFQNKRIIAVKLSISLEFSHTFASNSYSFDLLHTNDQQVVNDRLKPERQVGRNAHFQDGRHAL